MSIEHDLNRIANALEKLAVFVGNPQITLTSAEVKDAPAPVVDEAPAPKPAPAKKAKPIAEPAPAAVVTKDDVMDTLREFVRVKGQEKAKSALLVFGAGRISEIDPSKYADLQAALKEGLK